MKARVLLAALAAVVIALACVDFSDKNVDAVWCQNHPSECNTAGGGGGLSDAGKCTPGEGPIACFITNGFGTCPGFGFCSDAGVVETCTGKVPAMDICDGDDNDCDGPVDNPKITCSCGDTKGHPEICSNNKDDDCDGVTDCPGEPISFRTFGPATNGGDLVIQAVTATDAGTFIGGFISNGQFDFVDSGTPAGLSGSRASFVVRLAPEGGPAVWQTTLLTRSVTSTYFDESSGGLFVSGTYDNALGADAGCEDAPGGTGAVIYRLDPGTGDVVGRQFVCTFASLGTFKDARIAGTNADGGIVIAGTFDKELVFEPPGAPLFADGGLDGYVAVLAPGLDGLRSRQAFGASGDERVQVAALDRGTRLWVGATGTTPFPFFGTAVPAAGAFVGIVDLPSRTGLGAFNAGSAVSSITPVPSATSFEAVIGGGLSGPSTVGGCALPSATATSSYLVRTSFSSNCRWAHAFYGSNGTFITQLPGSDRLIAGGSYGSSLSTDFDAGTTLPTSFSENLWLGAFQPDSGTPGVLSGFGGASAFSPSASSGRIVAANYQGSFNFLGQPVSACVNSRCGMLIQVNP